MKPEIEDGGKNDQLIPARQEKEREQRDLITRICASRFFAGAPESAKLLRFLYESRALPVSEVEIGMDHFHARVDDLDGGRIRALCRFVRNGLIDYDRNDVARTNWKVFLPPAGRRGYQLHIVNFHEGMDWDHRFWRAHLDPVRPIVVIHDEPLFFRDEVRGTVCRAPQIETGESERALKLATEETRRLFREEVTEQMQPCHLYMLAGEVGARDLISDWFANGYGVKIESKVSRLYLNFSELAAYSPVILGNVRTSKIIQQLTAWSDNPKFGYYVDQKNFRTVEIRNATQQEKDILVGECQADQSGNDLTLCDNPRPGGTVFCVVTRMPNMYDEASAMTIFGSGYTKVIEIVAETFTNGTYLSEALKGSAIDVGKPFPRYFQALMSIDLGPTGADDRPKRPKLRCYRAFEE